MDPMDVVLAWDRSLRAGDWEAAQSMLSEDATYTATDTGADLNCSSADEIVRFLRSMKGDVPDVEVIAWEEHGDRVLAHLRQPAWGEDADWFQVLSTGDGRITRMEDFGTKESARSAIGAG